MIGLNSPSRTIDSFDESRDMVHLEAGGTGDRVEIFEESGECYFKDDTQCKREGKVQPVGESKSIDVTVVQGRDYRTADDTRSLDWLAAKCCKKGTSISTRSTI